MHRCTVHAHTHTAMQCWIWLQNRNAHDASCTGMGWANLLRIRSSIAHEARRLAEANPSQTLEFHLCLSTYMMHAEAGLHCIDTALYMWSTHTHVYMPSNMCMKNSHHTYIYTCSIHAHLGMYMCMSIYIYMCVSRHGQHGQYLHRAEASGCRKQPAKHILINTPP